MKWLRVALLALAPLPAAAQQPPSGVTITFLANEGVMLSSGASKVLIDGLFREYGPEFALPADSTRAGLEAARAPFDSVTAILVTHRHGDHFHPAAVAAHLAANPRAILITSAQVIDSLRGGLPAGHQWTHRLRARTTSPGSRRAETVGDLRIELLGLPHGGGRNRNVVEHLGFLVEIGGKRVLHVGDIGGDEADFAALRLDTSRIDVALLPQWFVASAEGRRVIEQWIKPRQVIAFHVGASQPERAVREVREAMPAARTFSRSLESLTIR